jgi:hypothetical protein
MKHDNYKHSVTVVVKKIFRFFPSKIFSTFFNMQMMTTINTNDKEYRRTKKERVILYYFVV